MITSPLRRACLAWCSLVVVAGCSSAEPFQTSTATGAGGGGGGGGDGGSGGASVAVCPFGWARSFGGQGSQAVASVAVDADCNVAATGTFATEIDFGKGPIASAAPGVFAAKLDPSGDVAWARTFAPFAEEPATLWMGWDTWKPRRATATGASGVMAFASRFGDGVDFGAGQKPAGTYLVALAADGALLWAKAFADSAGTADIDAVAMGPDGAVYAAGTFTGTVDLGAFSLSSDDGKQDGFLVQLDPKGDPVKSLRFDYQHAGPPDASTARYRDLTILPSGDVLLSGAYWNKVDFGSGVLQSSCGYSYINCQYWVASLFYVGISPAGAVTFSHSGQAMQGVPAIEVAFTPKTEILKGYVAQEGTQILRLLRSNLAGDISFSASAYAAPGSMLLLRGLASDAASDFLVAGYTEEPLVLLGETFPSGEFVARIDASGQLVRRSSVVGQAGPMTSAVLTASPGGSAVLGGAFEGTLVTDQGTVSASDGVDAAVLMLP